MKPHEIQEKLGLTRIRDRNWSVHHIFQHTFIYIGNRLSTSIMGKNLNKGADI